MALTLPESGPAFVSVTLTAEVPTADFVLELAGGRSMRILDTISAARLTELVITLEARGAS